MADTKVSALPAVSTPLAGTEEIPVNQGGTSKKVTVLQMSRAFETVKVVGTNQADTTASGVAITDLSTSLTAGTYLVKLWTMWQTAATTTGIQMYLKCSGGPTRCVATWYTLTTGTTATTGVADQTTTGGTYQTMEGRGQRASNAPSGPLAGVDNANAEQFSVMEGIVVLPGTQTLDVMFNTEVTSSAATILAGTTLTITKVA